MSRETEVLSPRSGGTFPVLKITIRNKKKI